LIEVFSNFLRTSDKMPPKLTLQNKYFRLIIKKILITK